MAFGRLVEVVAVLAGLVVFVVAEGARDEITVYPARCIATIKGACGEIAPLNRTVYRANADAETVVYWSKDLPATSPAKLTDCSIHDADNWTCPGRTGGLLRMRDGVGNRGDFGLEQGVIFVRWWHWHLARLAKGYALPLLPQQFE